MPRTISLLDRVRIASPCNVPWESMKGDNRTRHCDQCNLNVYNLADMPRSEAERLVEEHEGRMCARMYIRDDGTYLANDCPVGLRLALKAAAKTVILAGVLLTVIMQVASAVLFINPDTNWARWQQPFSKLATKLNPPVAPGMLMSGSMVALPHQPQVPVLPSRPVNGSGGCP